jgi:hypothetical protein
MTITGQGPGYIELELELIPALRREILEALPDIHLEALTIANARLIPDAQGIYFLYFKPRFDGSDTPAYIGKTDSKAGLRKRLSRHSVKIQGRQNIKEEDVYFRAIRLFVFTAMDIESDLIECFGGVKRIEWNNSGFGSNDPGKERDTTKYKADHFDTKFPIEIGKAFFDMPTGTMTVAAAMQYLKDQELLPYTLRFERPIPQSRNSFPPDFVDATVTFRPKMTVMEIISECMAKLPKGWHATALPSHIIVYKDDARKFPSGIRIAES